MRPKPIVFILFVLILIAICGAGVAIGYIADIGNGRVSPGDVKRIVEEIKPVDDNSQITVQIATGIGIKQIAEPQMVVSDTRTTIERAEPVRNGWLLALATALACVLILAGIAAANTLPNWPF